MSRVYADQPLLPSIWDRLEDRDIANTNDPVRSERQTLAEIREHIRRDLEHLMNTRQVTFIPPRLKELGHSLVNFGIPDLSTVVLGSEESREAFRRLVQDTLALFEPRFQHVYVHLHDDQKLSERTLNLRIEALLKVEPEEIAVVYDSQIDGARKTIQVREARHG